MPFHTSIKFPPITVPDASPMHVNQDMAADGVVKLTWSPPPRHNRNGRITEYEAVLQDSTTGQNVTKTSQASNPSAEFAVTMGNTYSFRVRASTSKGYGPWSTPVGVQPSDVPGELLYACFNEGQTHTLFHAYYSRLMDHAKMSFHFMKLSHFAPPKPI